jgi:hypothetical protein
MALKKRTLWICAVLGSCACLLGLAMAFPLGPVTTELVFKAESSCAQMPCFLSMKSIATGFQWEKMYVFDPQADEALVERVLQTHLPRYTQGAFKIAFEEKGKLVHYEEEPNDLTTANHNRVVFVLSKSKGYGEFSPDTVFNVSGGETGEGKYSVLWDYCHLTENGEINQGPCSLLD